MTLDELKNFALQIGSNVVINMDKQGIRATLTCCRSNLLPDVQNALNETNPAQAEIALGKALFSTTVEVIGFSYTYEKVMLQCRDAGYIETVAGLIFDDMDGTICIKEVLFPCFGVIKGLRGKTIEQAFIEVFDACDHKIKTVDIHSLIEDANTSTFVDAWKVIFIPIGNLDTERYSKLFAE